MKEQPKREKGKRAEMDAKAVVKERKRSSSKNKSRVVEETEVVNPARALGMGWNKFVQILSHLMLMYYMFTFIKAHFYPPAIEGNADEGVVMGSTSGSSPPESGVRVLSESQEHPSTQTRSAPINTNPALTHGYRPIWGFGSKTDFYCYLSTNRAFSAADFADPKSLIWQVDGLTFGNTTDSRLLELEVPIPLSVQNNGSWFAHLFWTQHGAHPSQWLQDQTSRTVLYSRKPLTRYLFRRRQAQRKNLLTGDNSTIKADLVDQIVSHIWPNITINIVAMQDQLPSNTPPLLFKHVRLSSEGFYYPIFYVNEFWMLPEHIRPLNESIKSINLSLSLSTIAFWQYTLYTQFEESFRIQNTMLGMESSETDQIKRMILETNPFLLAITFIVSLLHSLFDFLAFKNDVEFWRKKKNMEGVSFRSLLLNIGFQLVIFLYLLDNETSWMILISNFIGILIECWKVQRTVDVSFKPSFPFIKFQDKVKPSKLVAKTNEYDELAFRYMSYFLYPAIISYTIYSLAYESHKSWYSFVLGTLVGFVYTFGFITMTPQLFINYKLKSVAHMPWKTFMYKALNTFVDDLFAFVIKMPWLHRIACLRDDVIFFIYLYQRWIYPEDKKRRNEFGQVGEEGSESDEDANDGSGVEEAEEETVTTESSKLSPARLRNKSKNKSGIM